MPRSQRARLKNKIRQEESLTVSSIIAEADTGMVTVLDIEEA